MQTKRKLHPDKEGNRWCSMCDSYKAYLEFPEGRFTEHEYICKECRKVVQRRYRNNNQDKIKAQVEERKEIYYENRRTKYPTIRDKANEKRRWKHADPVAKLKHRSKNLYSKFGLTLEQFDEMDKRQNSCCYVCMKHKDATGKKVLNVDHNHTTGQVRKLLCHYCNTTLGLVNENPLILQSLINYITEHSGQVEPSVTKDVKPREQRYENE